jgi:dynein heavy chain
LRVQPHLKKCFEGVEKLDFETNLEIRAMVSKETEKVRMSRMINPGEAKGAVEKWMKEFETVMKETVQEQLIKANDAYPRQLRHEWSCQWPGQCVLAVSQIYWTQHVASALAGGRDHVMNVLAESHTQLQAIVMMVRGQLSKLNRKTLAALVVLDVHARDVVQSLLDLHVTDAAQFEWRAQLRYYLEDRNVQVRMITHTIEYGNEYLGNSPRLVITPLTDRCYRTLFSALQLGFGGAPEGPAGTGKTETVKDLAKAVGIQCVVFNCSDGLDFQAMGKFFKGLAASGAWSCFDEFNRIDLEVLSVIAQQIQCIQAAKDAKLEVFVFEGSEIPLLPRCSVFITMNPGYAGRSELPDNLKALFRTVSMMVPDYAMIAEITLYSFGFSSARALARKIVATYKLCSETLSGQDHYDYGMRAVVAVLSNSQQLKQEFPDADEQKLMLRSITDVNLPKFLLQDVPLFKGIISDLFPGVVEEEHDVKNLSNAINISMKTLNLQPVDKFVTKVLQLYDTVRVRHGLMLVGLPYAGKSACHKVLGASLTLLHEQKLMEILPVATTTINPKAIHINQLYGSFDKLSHEWTDGVLSAKFAYHAADTSERMHWLLFDGPVDAIWVESLNTVLDDNKKLCLSSGAVMRDNR